VQYVTIGFARLTTIFVYVPGGIVVERARKELSLCSLAKSTWYRVEFSGTFKDPPAEGLKETPTTVALKERRFVFGGGVSGTARSVSARMALLPWLGVPCP
jgi:hypothetical protein